MKKLLVSSLSIMIIGSILSSIPVNASTLTGLSRSNDILTTEEGNTIMQDKSLVNGSVDLDTPLLNPDDSILKEKSKSGMARASSKEIYIPFQTQQTDYYCGPAAARMVVGALGYNRTQAQMASLLGTTTAGTIAGNGVANALNSVVRGSRYQFRWQWHVYTNVATIKNHVLEAINYGNPVMVNTVESPGDVWIKGHNIGVPLYHFGVVADYFDYGNTVTYTDPGAGRFRGFIVDQRLSITNLSNATGTRGYAW